jgi:hypothetical protein
MASYQFCRFGMAISTKAPRRHNELLLVPVVLWYLLIKAYIRVNSRKLQTYWERSPDMSVRTFMRKLHINKTLMKTSLAHTYNVCSNLPRVRLGKYHRGNPMSHPKIVWVLRLYQSGSAETLTLTLQDIAALCMLGLYDRFVYHTFFLFDL